MSTVALNLAQVHQLAERCLAANGCDAANAAALADTIGAAERDGCHAHGLFRVPGYVASLRSGKVDGKAAPRVEQLAPGVVRVDAGGGYAPLALQHGRQPLIDCARTQGIAALAMVNMHHFSALWIEVEAVARAGLAALACTAYMPAVAPAGASQPFFGTNPMAFGWPRGERAPLVFDQASAAMARGEVMIAAREGHSLPPGVGLDAQGAATTDPQAIIDGGVLLPFGGYKGASIALLVELLAAGLIGQAFSFEAKENDNGDGGPPRGGEFILAMDPSRFGDANWLAHAEGFFARLGGIAGVRLPGDRRYANRERNAAANIEVPRSLHDRIVELTGD